jgi:hypothetical protein
VEADGIDSEGKTIIKIKKDLLTNTWVSID